MSDFSAAGNSMTVFSIVLAAASLGLFVVAVNGYSIYPYTMLYSAWGKASGTNLVSGATERVTLYLGFRITAYTWTSQGINYISSISNPNSACSDGGSTATALLITSLFTTTVTIVVNCYQLGMNSNSLKYSAIFFSMTSVIFSAVAWATWYQTCYVDQYIDNPNLSDLTTFTGINCAIAGMSLMFVSMCLNCVTPVPMYADESTYGMDGPNALGTPPLYGQYSNVQAPPVQTPVEGKVIGVVS